jgi:hypothetical protein
MTLKSSFVEFDKISQNPYQYRMALRVKPIVSTIFDFNIYSLSSIFIAEYKPVPCGTNEERVSDPFGGRDERFGDARSGVKESTSIFRLRFHCEIDIKFFQPCTMNDQSMT